MMEHTKVSIFVLGFVYLTKKAPGLQNGPWKWLLACACSTLYRLEFFMWQLGCWDMLPRGCALIKAGSSGHFFLASCGHWPPFHPWAHSYTAALLPGLSVSTNNALGFVTWLEWLLTRLASCNPSPPVNESVRMITNSIRVTCAPLKWRRCPWAFEGRIFPSWQCQNIMSEMANFMCHLKAVRLQYYSRGKMFKRHNKALQAVHHLKWSWSLWGN